jgi:hypothetical protein
MVLSEACAEARLGAVSRSRRLTVGLLVLLANAWMPTFALAQQATSPPIPVFQEADGYSIVFQGTSPNGKEGVSVANPNLLFSDGNGGWSHLYPCTPKSAIGSPCFGAAIVAPGATAVVVSGIPAAYSGPQTITLRSDTSIIGTVLVTLSPLTWTETIWGAVAATALLLAIVLVLGGRTKRTGTPNGQTRTLLSLFIVDPDSNTCSLSNLQLYLWLSATLFGYIYLFVGHIWVQGILSIPDVQLPIPSAPSLSVTGGLILAVGTTVVSNGVNSLIGGKGSGDFRPSWSDFITSGGTVAPERVQFLIWTIIAIISYIVVTIYTSPATISSLPIIPPELLALSGISAAGYLGGKIARGPGPQIKTLSAKLPAVGESALTIDFSGSAIATKGSAFFVADITGTPQGATDIPIQPLIEPGSAVDSSTGLATHLILTVPQPAGIVWAGSETYRFTVINPDGERASWEFNAT